MVGETFTRGLRSVERQDAVALVQLRADTEAGPAAAALSVLIEAAFPRRLSFTLAPGGDASIVVPEAELDLGLSMLPNTIARSVRCGLTAISAAGVCMSAAENKVRHICASLAHAGIPLRALSLCDLAATLTVDTADAGRALEIICTAVPLTL